MRALNDTQECREGELFVFDSGIPHGFFLSDDRNELRMVRVSFTRTSAKDENDTLGFLLESILNGSRAYEVSVLNSTSMSEICRICGLIRNELTSQSFAKDIALQSYLNLLLTLIGRYTDLADRVAVKHSKEWHLTFAAMSAAALEYLDPAFTLTSISERMFVSPSSLSRAFVKVTGEPFPEYLRRVRMRAACELLEYTDLNNDEIAARCGIRDMAGFYKGFKKIIGMTPLDYRKLNRNSSNIKGEKHMVTVKEISENLQNGRAKIVKSLVEHAIAEGASAEDILNSGLIAGMNVIGERFKKNEIFVPEVLMAARAMNMGMQVLKPILASEGVQATGKVCIGTVQGDLHDIGKNLVKMMLEGKGLEVVDLGVDVPAEKFVQAAIDEGCQVICCSALLTTTMPIMKKVVEAAETAGIRDKVKIMVGGAPVSEDFCHSIGADVYTPDAASAAQAAVDFCKNA